MSEPLIAKISLKKLKANALKVKSLLKNNVKLCAVVKSDAYGHGINEIASALYSICDYFAVSLLSECEILRISGIDKPILLLTPASESTIERLILRDITLPVSSVKELLLIYKTAKKLGKKVKVHFAINTGMNRLGFDDEYSIKKALGFIKNNEYILLEGAYSHFGDVKDKAYTEKCFQIFKKLTKPILQVNKKAILHIASSEGLIASDKYQLGMVRIGLLLYGYNPSINSKIQVEPIMQVYAKNLFSRTNVKNKRLMYGDALSQTNEVSIVRLGYADGFFRSNESPFVNNLCMDLSAVKKTDNDYVLVLKDAKELSKKLNTIPYEILVSVTKRAIREYFY